MTVGARCFQVLFLAVGLVLLVVALTVGAGYSEGGGHWATLEVDWSCHEGNCSTDELPRSSIEFPRTTDFPVVLALTGVGFMIASASVAIGGRRPDWSGSA
ncbi:hypothetical protein ACFXK0_01280 [Nocardia sp. NPDC059177]|uniref:hypothetical protein n=1 Tax=Nocardia sp. NPDC059177 TaxID=3346759 RepID=UPI003692F354